MSENLSMWWEAIWKMDTLVVISTIAAAFGAIFAAWQLYFDRRWRKLDRTYSHSPYRSELFLDKRNKLSEVYHELKISRDDLKKTIG